MTIDEIRLEIDASRRAIRQDYGALRRELDFVTKTKQAVAGRPLPWLGGAALFGWVLSGRRKRKAQKLKGGKPVKEKTARQFTLLGLLLTVARLVFPLVRPQLTTLAVQKLTALGGRFGR
jgi:hypothetical protein